MKIINLAPRGGGGQTQTKTADSSTVLQQITPDAGYDAMTRVTINPYTLQSKSVTLTSETQTITPDTSYNGLSSVEVPAVVLQQKTITPTTSEQTFNPPAGKDGFSRVIVHGVTSSIDSNIVADNIKKDVSILGVTGTLEQEVTICNYTPVKYISNEDSLTYAAQPYFNLNYSPTINTKVEITYSMDCIHPFTGIQGGQNQGRFLGTYTGGNNTFAIGSKIGFGNIGRNLDVYKIQFQNGRFWYNTGGWEGDVEIGRGFMPDKMTFGVDASSKFYTMVNDTAIAFGDADISGICGPMFLFGTSNDSGVLNSQPVCHMRVYDLKIYESGTEVKHFIPVLNSDSAAALYETHDGSIYNVANQYAAAAGPIGTFTIGDDIEDYHPYIMYYNTSDGSMLNDSSIENSFIGLQRGNTTSTITSPIHIVSHTYSLSDEHNGYFGKVVFDKMPYIAKSQNNMQLFKNSNVTAVVLPSEVHIIQGMFFESDTLSHIDISDRLLKYMYSPGVDNYTNTFKYCRNLYEIKMPIYGYIDSTDHDAFFDQSKIRTIIIPKHTSTINLSYIGEGGLQSSVYFPENITYLGRSTMCGTSVVGGIIFESEIPCNIQGNSFAVYDSYIYVPDAALTSYQTATNWNNYSEQIKPYSQYGS